jgi:hypothetical protein
MRVQILYSIRIEVSGEGVIQELEETFWKNIPGK